MEKYEARASFMDVTYTFMYVELAILALMAASMYLNPEQAITDESLVYVVISAVSLALILTSTKVLFFDMREKYPSLIPYKIFLYPFIISAITYNSLLLFIKTKNMYIFVFYLLIPMILKMGFRMFDFIIYIKRNKEKLRVKLNGMVRKMIARAKR